MTMTFETPLIEQTNSKRKIQTRNKIQTSYTITPEAIEKLKTLAEADGLSPSGELEIMIRDRYNRRKHKLQKESSEND